MIFAAATAVVAGLSLTPIGEATSGTVEIRGVGAGAFNPVHWERNTINWNEDIQRPLLPPREGMRRNIYAPSAVETADGNWHVYYGGWDGIEQGQDHIYLTTTPDFRTFGDRHTLIQPGPFEHICNVNAVPGDNGTSLVCTVYPTANKRNKPALFSVPNGSFATTTASPADIVEMTGYEKYEDGDINGMNVLLRDGGKWHLYFGSFTDFGQVYRASSGDGGEFAFDGKSLDGRLMVNDVKKFQTSAGSTYLMGLHQNGSKLSYALSSDGMTFESAQPLVTASGDDERYMVALGWVTAGAQEDEGRRLLGVLYGAGQYPTLDQNRIFARWLQKRLVFPKASGVILAGAAGPDIQVLKAASSGPISTELSVLAEDGLTTVAIGTVQLRLGKAYQLAMH